MPLSEQDIEALPGRVAAGETISALAAAHEVTTAAIRYHLKKAGHGAATPRGPFSDDESPSDEDLGIGEEDAPAAGLDINALLAHPDFAKIVNAAVGAKLKSVGAPAAAFSGSGDGGFDLFLKRLEEVIGVAAEQKPGYIKPLTTEQVTARRQGHSDMLQLMTEFKTAHVKPVYLLNQPFYGPSPSGPVLYEAGQEITTCLAPSEEWEPQNEPAARVFEAYRRWVGDPTTIEDLLATALINARGGPRPMEVTAEPAATDSDVQLVDKPKRDVQPNRTLGTVTPERRGVAMPGQPGVVGQPVGPFNVGEGA
jgi:hypothetical protein